MMTEAENGKVPKSVTKRKQPSGGSRKGKPNKNTAEIKNMILEALSQVGGVDYLVRQAEEKPVAFMGLIAKVLPTQVTGAGENGEHLASVTVTFK